MKALFITTTSNDCFNHVRAWNSCFLPAIHHTFDLKAIRNDWQAVEIAQEEQPDIIFYIGATDGPGIPRFETFCELQKTAPIINLCSDAADWPWHKTLELYERQKCFNLQVSIDGALKTPVDFVTLTPIDARPFKVMPKNIRCGFSGTVGMHNSRSEMINSLEWFGKLFVRRRERGDNYEDHAYFMNQCQILFNTSWTGTEDTHHIKGRVLESGFAGCALLEHEDSPVAEWFPKGSWFSWKTPKDAAEIIHDASDEEINSVANALSQTVKENFTAKQIYGEILAHVGLT